MPSRTRSWWSNWRCTGRGPASDSECARPSPEWRAGAYTGKSLRGRQSLALGEHGELLSIPVRRRQACTA
eukprot:2489767-Pyramimonas_sp.AAC.2